MEFQVEQFNVKRLSDAGLWIVTTDKLSDLGLLFLRAQEFYESSNPEFIGKAFTVIDFIKWYSLNVAENKNEFSYFEDFQGYNIPKEALDRFEKIVIPDLNHQDVLFARIVQGVRCLQTGDFYLIGGKTGHVPIAQHEIAHGMFALMPEYKTAAIQLVESLSSDVTIKVIAALQKEGYSEAVVTDETQAYFATGLLASLEEFEHLREPFMKLFFRSKKKFMRKRSRRRSATKRSDTPHADTTSRQSSIHN